MSWRLALVWSVVAFAGVLVSTSLGWSWLATIALALASVVVVAAGTVAWERLHRPAAR